MRTQPPSRIRAVVDPFWRLRAYATALGLVLASVPLLHLYMDVDLSPVELAIHAIDISLGALCVVVLLEIGVSAAQRRLTWRIDASRLEVAGWLAASVVIAVLLLQLGVHDVLPATAEIRAKHEAAGYRDMSVRALPFVALLGYLAFASLRGRWLANELEELRALVTRLERPWDEPEGALAVRNDGVDERLPIRSIAHVRAEENYCRIQLAPNGDAPARELLVRMTLTRALAELPRDRFLQVHRSHVVGLAHVRGARRRQRRLELLMSVGEPVPVSRARAPEVRARARTAAALAALCGLALGTAGARVAAAHPLAPALLELREHGDGRVEVRWQTSRYRPSAAAAHALRPLLPAHCTDPGEPSAELTDAALVERWEIACGPAPLVGARVGVAGLDENGIDALLRVELADGRRVRRVLSPSSPSVAIPGRERRVDVAAGYASMGVRHILGGPDHLLFVFGLVLLVSGLRPLLWTLTAFTLGHSVTLSLAALGSVAAPTRPIELLIAASVLLLAVELAGSRTSVWRGRAAVPAAFAAAFGLLHGLGFAGALREAGLPAGEIPTALLAFNVGIEAGQIAFVAFVVAVRRAAGGVAPVVARLGRPLAVYAMGTLAAMWCIERAVDLGR